MKKDYFAHETAVIDEGVEIGAGTKIWHFSHIMTGCRIGENCNLGQNVVVSPEVVLGKNVKVQIDRCCGVGKDIDIGNSSGEDKDLQQCIGGPPDYDHEEAVLLFRMHRSADNP